MGALPDRHQLQGVPTISPRSVWWARRKRAFAHPRLRLPRRVLEALAVEEFRLGRLTHTELRRLLGFGTRQTLDAFLKAHGLFAPSSLDELDHDRNDLRRLGF